MKDLIVFFKVRQSESAFFCLDSRVGKAEGLYIHTMLITEVVISILNNIKLFSMYLTGIPLSLPVFVVLKHREN